MLVVVVFELFIDKRVSLPHALVTLDACRGLLLVNEVCQNKIVGNVCTFVQVIVEFATWSIIKVCVLSSKHAVGLGKSTNEQIILTDDDITCASEVLEQFRV